MSWYRKTLPVAWVLAVIAGGGSVAAWSGTVPSVPRPVREPPASPGALAAVDTSGLAPAAATIRNRNPFRLERKPATVRYNPWEPAHPVVSAPPPPARPSLSLVGLLGGPPWNVLIAGVPGRQSGVLLRLGQEVNGIRFTELRADTVVLAGLDTTWLLLPRRPWR